MDQRIEKAYKRNNFLPGSAEGRFRQQRPAILEIPYEQAVEKIKAALKKEGFGVLTEIDVKGTLNEKLNVEFRKYVILGACNPQLAYKSLSHDLNVGLLLPCNVIVYENDAGKIVVSAVDPNTLISLASQKKEMCELANRASEMLQRAIENLA